MNWAELAGRLVAAGAPILGSLLLGPVGGTMGGVVGNILSTALGVPATPEAIAQKLDTDPLAVEQVREAESAHSNDLKAFEASLLDAQNARTMLTTLTGQGSRIGYTVPVLTFVLVTGFFVALIALFVVGRSPQDPVAAQMINIMLGALITGSSQAINFWFGTTKSSHDNGVAMRQVAAAK